MRRFFMASLAGVALSAGEATADGFYFYGNVAAQYISEEETNGFEVSYETGFSAGDGIGYDLGAVSFEVLGEFGSADLDRIDGSNASGDISWFAAIPTVYYNWRQFDLLMPRLGFGIGYIDVNSNDVENDEFIFLDASEDYVLYQGSFGIFYSIDDHMKLGPIYRLRLIDNVEFDEAVHIGEIGVMYSF